MAQPGGYVLPGEFPLQDGTPALIWPLLPTDAEMLRDGFRRLSRESRQHRFLQVLGELDDSMIRRLVGSVDGVHHITLVLIVLPPEGKEGRAGVARLLQYPDDPATADIAVTVADDWQEREIGTALLSALLQRRPAPVTRLRTIVEAGNRRSLALLAGAGRMSAGPPERGVLDVTVELAAPARPARTPAARDVTPIPLPHQPAHQRRWRRHPSRPAAPRPAAPVVPPKSSNAFPVGRDKAGAAPGAAALSARDRHSPKSGPG